MAKAVTRHWYRVVLASDDGTAHAVAASGEHMGEAIAEAERADRGTRAIAVDVASDDEIPLGESVGKGQVVQLGDIAVALADLRWPVGVLPSLIGAPAVAAARPGWLVRPRQDGLLVVEAQAHTDQLIDLFMGVIERLPAADNLEVRVLDHFENAATTDVWLTARVDSKWILRFLDDHDEELFGNGHVELSVYLRKLKATLRLTEHKTVAWLAAERALEAEIPRWFGELGVPAATELVTAGSAPHFHFRPAKSRDRKRLGEELYRQRLRKVDSIKSAAAAAPSAQ